MPCTSLHPLPCPLWDKPILSSSFCFSRSWDLNKICYKSGVPIIENGMIERVSAGHGWAPGAPQGVAVDPRGHIKEWQCRNCGEDRACQPQVLWWHCCLDMERCRFGKPSKAGGETGASDPSLLTPRISS